MSSAVKDTYTRLTGLVKKRFAGHPDRELVLARHEQAPQVWDKPLAEELTAAGAAGDQDLVAAAQALMRLVDEAGVHSGEIPGGGARLAMRAGRGSQHLRPGRGQLNRLA